MGVRLWRSPVSKSELPRIGGSLDNLKNQAQSRQMREVFQAKEYLLREG